MAHVPSKAIIHLYRVHERGHAAEHQDVDTVAGLELAMDAEERMVCLPCTGTYSVAPLGSLQVVTCPESSDQLRRGLAVGTTAC